MIIWKDFKKTKKIWCSMEKNTQKINYWISGLDLPSANTQVAYNFTLLWRTSADHYIFIFIYIYIYMNIYIHIYIYRLSLTWGKFYPKTTPTPTPSSFFPFFFLFKSTLYRNIKVLWIHKKINHKPIIGNRKWKTWGKIYPATGL